MYREKGSIFFSPVRIFNFAQALQATRNGVKIRRDHVFGMARVELAATIPIMTSQIHKQQRDFCRINDRFIQKV